MEPITVSIPNAASAIGVGRNRIYQMIASGEIEAVKIGGRRLVKVSSLHDLINRSSANAKQG